MAMALLSQGFSPGSIHDMMAVEVLGAGANSIVEASVAADVGAFALVVANDNSNGRGYGGRYNGGYGGYDGYGDNQDEGNYNMGTGAAGAGHVARGDAGHQEEGDHTVPGNAGRGGREDGHGVVNIQQMKVQDVLKEAILKVQFLMVARMGK